MADIRIVPSAGAINVTGSADFRGTGGSTILYLTGSGQIGAGTTNPDSEFHIVGSGTRFVTLDRSGTRSYDLGVNSSGTFLVTDNTVSADRISLSHSGSVGIGTTSPTQLLHLVNASGPVIRLVRSSNRFDIEADTNSAGIVSRDSATANFSITGFGNVGIGSASPAVPLDVVGKIRSVNANDQLTIKRSDNTGTRIGHDALGLYFANDDASLAVLRIYGGTSGAERFVIGSGGAVKLSSYGSGTFTGTAAKTLAVDSSGNVIEINNTGLDGSGTANYVTKWSDSDSLTNSVMYDDGTNIGIGLTTPGAPLHVFKTATYSAIISRADWNSGTETRLGIGKQYGVLGYISTDLVETTNDTSYIALNYKSGLSSYAEGLRVYNNGNVGIGTTNPTAKLFIEGNDIVLNTEGSTQGKSLYFRYSDGATVQSDSYLKFNTGGSPTEKVRILADGNVGIGNTNPNQKLVVAGNIAVSSSNTEGAIWLGEGQDVGLFRNNTYDLVLSQEASSGNPLYLAGAGNVVVSIDSNNNGTSNKFIVGSNAVKSSNELFSVNESGNVYVSNDLNVDGKITAREFHTSFVSASIIYQSGSTQFGNSSDDKHIFTGNVGIGTASPSYTLDVQSNLSSEPYVQARFLNTNSSGTEYGGILVNGTNQAHIRFLTGTSTWGGAGAKQWQIRSGIGANVDALSIYSWTVGADVIYFNSSGNVGIGSTGPSYRLDVDGGGALTTARFYNSSNAATVVYFGDSGNTDYSDIILQTNSGTGEIFKAGTGYTSYGGALALNIYNSNGPIAFHPNGTANAMFIANSGNVGIGSISPAYPLDVNGNVRAGRIFTTGLYGPSTGGNIAIWQYDTSNTGYGIIYAEGSPDTLRIDVSGNALTGTPDFLVGENYAQINGNTVWHAGNDGPGSGLDADLLDGQHGSYYTNATNIDSGTLSNSRLPSAISVTSVTASFKGNLDGNATTATTATNVAWTGVTAGERTDYDLGFEAPATGYAGFYFSSPGATADAGYFLIRGGADNDVYTQNGITLVADAGWLTLAQRTTASKGIRFMTGTTSTTRMSIFTDGTIGIGTSDALSNMLLVAGSHPSGYSILGVRPGADQVATLGFYNTSNVRKGLLYTTANFFSLESDNLPIALMPGSANVGIGTTSPAGKLDVRAGSGGRILFGSYDANYYAAFEGGDQLNFYNGASNATGYINYNGPSAVLLGRNLHVEGNSSGGTTGAVRIKSDGNVGIGLTNPGAKLQVSGTVATDSALADVDAYRIIKPNGGVRVTSNSSETGAIKITYPVGWTNTMHRVKLNVYEYTTNESFTIYFGGYNYAPGGGYWYNVFAYLLNNPGVDRNFTVRFGYDGTSLVVYIGELASGWTYPQIFIEEVELGYSGLSSTWRDGAWGIGFEASAFQNVAETISNPQATNWARNGTSVNYDFGNVGIGTTSPIGKLQIGGTSGNLLTVGTLTNDWVGNIAMGITNGNGVILSKINAANDTNRVLVFLRDDTNGASIFGYTPTGGGADIGFQIRANASSYFNGGNVGIGATSPAAKLHIKNTVAESTGIIIENTNNAQNLNIDFWNNVGAVQGRINYAEGAGDFNFYPNTGAGEVLTLKYGGNVGIGTNSPGYKLQIEGTTAGFSTIGAGDNVRTGLAHYDTTAQATGVGGQLVLGYKYTDAGDFTEGAIIKMYKENSASSQFGSGLKFQVRNTGDNLSTKVTIDPSGNVGIGSVSPGAKLHVKQTGIADNTATTLLLLDGQFQDASIEGADMVSIGFRVENSTGGSQSSQAISFAYDNTLSLMKDGGTVGVGTTSATNRLTVYQGAGVRVTGITSGDWIEMSGNLPGYTDNQYPVIKSNGTIHFAVNNKYSGYLEGSNTYFGILDSSTVTRVFLATSGNTYFTGGNVGIGTTSPSFPLHVVGYARASGFSVNDGSGTVSAFIGYEKNWIGSGTSATLAIAAESQKINFYAGGTTDVRMMVSSSGNVGIGNTAPNERLELSVGNGVTGGLRINYAASATGEGMDITYLNTGATTTSFDSRYNSDSAVMQFRMKTAATAVNAMTILGNGNVGIGTTSPTAKVNVLIGAGGANGTVGLKIGGTGNYDSLELGIEDGYNGQIRTYGNDLHLYSGHWRTVGSTATEDHAIRFFTSKTSSTNWSTAKMILTADGNVGIGSNSPGWKLDVAGNARIGDNTDQKTHAALQVSAGQGSASTYRDIDLKGNWAAGEGHAITANHGTTSTSIVGQIVFEHNSPGSRIKFGRLYDSGDQSTYPFHMVSNGSAGRLGIGTSVPTAPLDTLGVRVGRDFSIANRATIRLDSNTADYPADILFGHTAAANQSSWDGVYWSVSSRGSGEGNKFYIYRAGSNPGGSGEEVILSLQPNGNVGIGSVSPAFKLDVAGTIRATGDVIAYSDARVKENIVTLENSLDLVQKLRGVRYNRIGESENKVGVIAQEVLEVLPEVVQQDQEGNYSVAYGNITAVLIEAIKQQQLQIDELKQEIKQLKG